MRTLRLALAVTILALAPASLHAAPPIEGWKPPAELTFDEKDVKQFAYDSEEIGYPNPAGGPWLKLKPAGKTWRVWYRGNGKGPELDALMRKSLKVQGWELLTKDGLVIAKRTVGSKTEWVKAAPYDKGVKAVFLVESDPPHSLTLVEPKATPETFGDADDFPYLAHFPEAKLKNTVVGSSAIHASPPGVKPELFAGPPTLNKYYELPSTYAPLELVTVYKTALEKAGWTILSTAVGSDGALDAHYAKNGRDIFVYIHDGMISVADVGVQNEAKKLADALAKDGHIAIYGIYFDVDKDVLKGESETALQHILDLLKKNPKLKVEIQGHTDDTGDAAHNQKLSDDRAASVKKWLVDKGIAGDRLKTKGYGATKPVGDNKTPEGRHLNRRVELAKL